MKNLAIFASGNGTNAEKILEHFHNHATVRVVALFTNNQQAGVIDRVARFNTSLEVFDKATLTRTNGLLDKLREYGVDWIALAGFMLMVPFYLVKAFPKRIINIHPALLPAYGGKGMYGMNVHWAVVEAQEEVTGITIHYVNENYDEGAVIFQASCEIDPKDTPETVAQKVHQLEHQYYPLVLEDLITMSN
ncbi:MAG: phosphoribosylglycinamide formyltransferase [Bacteroidota bacterium]